MQKSLIYAALIMLAASHGSFAADEAAMATPQTTSSGVRYLGGGIGDGEQSAFEAQKKNFNLRLTFVQKNSGAYVADVQVLIRDKDQRDVLNVLVPGPFLFAQLAPGTYQLTATYNGESQHKTLTVKTTSNHVFYFASE